MSREHCTAQIRHLECWVQSWGRAQERHGHTEQVQQSAMKTTKGLEHLTYEERLRGLAAFSLGKRRFLGNLVHCINTSGGWEMAHVKTTKPDSSQCCLVIGQMAVATN